MEFGCFFVGQRPLVHEQYADGQRLNPNPVSRTDAEVYHDIELLSRVVYAGFTRRPGLPGCRP
jgi:hypothetical protein